MFVLPQPFARRSEPAAFAVALGVIAAALAIDSAGVAAAQGRLDAEYVASLAGIPIGRGNWVVEVGDDQYSAVATGGTTGLLQFFTGAKGTTSSHGTLSSGGQPAPTGYASTITYDRRVDDVRMVLAGGSVKDYSVEPPVKPHPESHTGQRRRSPRRGGSDDLDAPPRGRQWRSGLAGGVQPQDLRVRRPPAL